MISVQPDIKACPVRPPMELADDPTQWFPMPAALVTSWSASSGPNVMGIGYVGFFSWRPPIIGLGINTARYSGQVIRETGEFVVALPDRGQVLRMDYCGFVSGMVANKLEAAGFTWRPATNVSPPLIDGCAVHFECRLHSIMELGSHDLFLGTVVGTHIEERYLTGEQSLAPIILASRRYVCASEFIHQFGESQGNPPEPMPPRR